MAAGWGERNLGRFRNATDAYDRGATAKFRGGEALRDQFNIIGNMGFTGFQNELNRELERTMPNIRAEANVNEQEGLRRNRARSLGILNKFDAPTSAPSALPPLSAPEPLVNNLQTYDPSAKPMNQPPPSVVPSSQRTDFSSPYSQDAYRQFMEKNKATPENFENLIPENLRGGVSADDEATLATNAPRPYGVTTDQSGLAGPRAPRSIIPEQLKIPETVKMPGTKAEEVIPEQFKTPAVPDMKETALLDSAPGKKFGPAGRSWEGDMPEAWGKDMEDYDVDKKIREAKETDQWRMRSDEVEEEYGNTKPQAWKDRETMRRVFGYEPIDYREKGGSFDEDMKRKTAGSLSNLVRTEMGEMWGSPKGKQYFTFDATTGSYKINDPAKADEALAFVSDIVARRSEPGVSSTQFAQYTDRDDWKKYMADISNPPQGMTKEQAIAKWRDEVIFPYLKQEFTEKGVIAAEDAAAQAKGADLNWQRLGDALGNIFGGPLEKMDWATKPPPKDEKTFNEYWKKYGSFRETVRMSVNIYGGQIDSNGSNAWQEYRNRVIPGFEMSRRANPSLEVLDRFR